jgi:SAM-dependent methyltransferase
MSEDWPLACPACRTPLGPLSSLGDEARCPGCGLVYPCVKGIWRFLPPERAIRFAPFLADYTRIRLAEQRGSEDPAYYLDLPDCPPDHPIAWQWALRRRTFAALTRRVLPGLARRSTSPRVVDLGAGVGWLSNRLALLGHQSLAIDLTTDDRDGLGAGRHYEPSWPRIQAEFDRLPLADGAADLVIFNASLHYSTDYAVTLGEALRVLVRGGSVIVLETPLYKSEESGRRMVAERHADFERRFGTRSEALPSREYLTWTEVAGLGRQLEVRFRAVTPWYGWRWAARPWVARLKRRREPSRFAILLAEKP